MKEQLSPTSFRLPKSLLKAFRTKCVELETTQGEAVIAAIQAWIGGSASDNERVEWFLESVRMGTSEELLRVMKEEGRKNLSEELLKAIDEWTDPESDGFRIKDRLAADYDPNEKDFKKKVDAILNSGDMKSVIALGATIDLVFERMQPSSARRKSGS